jgi:hypothetical protein
MAELREKIEQKNVEHINVTPIMHFPASESIEGHIELNDNDEALDVILDVGDEKGEGVTNLKLARDGHVSHRHLQLGP